MKRSTANRESAPPEGRTLGDTVYAALRRDILAGALAPGMPLRYADLRARFGLGMGTIREALTRLAGERLVTASGQKGFRVPSLSLHELRDIMRMRTELEIIALKESLAVGGDEWEAGILAAFHRLSKAAVPVPGEAGADAYLWEELHSAFHAALIAACTSRLLFTYRESLEDQSVRYRRLRMRADAPESIKRDVTREHRDMMEAALARDEARAVQLLHDHFARTERMVASAFG
jgi:DNA-binding GntR family transcriptional regulator